MFDFIKSVFSESGEPSSKRVFGGLSYIACISCIVYLVHKDGGSSVVESLIQTLLITSSGLLGISSITNAFGNNKTEVNGQE